MHAYTTFGFINSVRVDYGYSCIAGAGPGQARIFATGYSRLEIAGGKKTPPPKTRLRSKSDHLIFVCHGIHQTSSDMDLLIKQLQSGHTAAAASHPTGVQQQWSVIAHEHDWRQPVLLTGIELAKAVSDRVNSTGNCQSVILFGYSQGGLVCRVAATALRATNDLKLALQLGAGLYRNAAR